MTTNKTTTKTVATIMTIITRLPTITISVAMLSPTTDDDEDDYAAVATAINLANASATANV